MSYIFGGNTGISYADLVKARQQQEMYRRQQEAARNNIGAPTTFGGGLNAVGGAIASIISGRKADKIGKEADAQEQQLRSGYRSALGELLGGSLGGGSRNTQPAPVTRNQAMAANGGPTNAAVAAWDGKSRGNPYRDAIASIESAGSGDYSAIGPTNSRLGRALGRYQIMEANIGPWSREALGREVTPDEFLNSPEIQDAIFDHKFNGYVEQFGPEGAAQAWFAGPGGVGKMDRKDVLGTSVGDYTQKFKNALGGGTMSARQPQGGQPQNLPPNNQVAGGGNLPQILELMNSPFASEQDRQVLGMMAERIMNPPKPETTDDIREYEFARRQGYQGTFQDFMGDMKRAGASNVSVTNQMGQPVEPLGTKGQILVPDANAPSGFRVEIAQGSELDMERQRQAQADERSTASRAENQATQRNVVLDTVGKIRAELDNPGIMPDVGVFGSKTTGFNQQAANVAGMLDTLKGMVVFDRLEKLKAASATGASGLGQVTEREIALLGAQLGALENNLSPELIRDTLGTVETVFGKLSPEAQAYLMGEGGDTFQGGTDPQGGTMAQIPAEPPANLSQEDKDLWQWYTDDEKAIILGNYGAQR